MNQRKKVQKKLILNENVSEKIVKILRKIVTNEEGTAGLANINGYEIAGKTGTAEQVIDGQYSNIKINTFASVFPSSKPKFVFIVMLDSLRGSQILMFTIIEIKMGVLQAHLLTLQGGLLLR